MNELDNLPLSNPDQAPTPAGELFNQISYYLDDSASSRMYVEIMDEFDQTGLVLDILKRANMGLVRAFTDGRAGGSILDRLYATRRAVMSRQERQQEELERKTLDRAVILGQVFSREDVRRRDYVVQKIKALEGDPEDKDNPLLGMIQKAASLLGYIQ